VLRGRDFEAWDEPAITPRDNLPRRDSPANASRSASWHELARPPAVWRRQRDGAASYASTTRYSAEMAIEIVGVVKDVHYAGVRQGDDLGIIYVPSWQ